MLNQNLKEIPNNVNHQFEDYDFLTRAEYIAGKILWHNNHIEDIKEAAERHNNSFNQEVNELIEEFTEIEDHLLYEDIKQLLIKEMIK